MASMVASDSGSAVFEDVAVAYHHGVHEVGGDKRIAVGARHLFVDFRDHHEAVLGRGLDDVHRDAEAQVAVLVRRAGLDERNVERDPAKS